MLLKDIMSGNQSLIYMERYVNCGSPSGFSTLYTTSPETSPKGKKESFYLCGIDIADDIEVCEFGNEPSFFKTASWKMLVHPDMIKETIFSQVKSIEYRAVKVAPTSSSRTVMILDDEEWYLKLCYKGLIGRLNRQLGLNQAKSAIEVSRCISEAIDKGKLPQNLFLFREVFGRVIKLQDEGSLYEWGIVAREPWPYPLDPPSNSLVPAFSLFSKDENNSSHSSILNQLVVAQNKPPEVFVFDDIIAPIYTAYFSLLLNCGLQLEGHAQNVLFVLDEKKSVKGVAIRDAESIDKDFSLMKELDLEIPFSTMQYKCLERGQYNYSIMHSFMFDFKLGEYLITPIIEEVEKFFGINKRSMIEKIRGFNREYIARLPADYFPADGCWYSYANVVHDQDKRRPYVANYKPRYR